MGLKMAVNKHRPHVVLVPEDEKDRQIGTGTVSVSSGPCSEQESVHGAAREMELVAMMKSLVNESIRWDNLRALLLQKRPNPFLGLQSDDAFMKLLQSMETGGSIELRYDAIQRTYYVERP